MDTVSTIGAQAEATPRANDQALQSDYSTPAHPLEPTPRELILRVLAEQGMRRSAVAKRIGVDPGIITRILSGKQITLRADGVELDAALETASNLAECAGSLVRRALAEITEGATR